MAKTRIKKPVRKKKKSDYPGEMSFRKALGMNPTYYQDGGDYNMQRALEIGYTPDKTGHWQSVDSTNGMWLKSKQHPTAWMEYMHGYALNPENNRRFDVVPNVEGYFGDNQLQYVEKNRQEGGKLYYQQERGLLPPKVFKPNPLTGQYKFQQKPATLKWNPPKGETPLQSLWEPLAGIGNPEDESTYENVLEILDPTGISSWDDVYKEYQESGMSPETKLEIFGALPLLGKVGKLGKSINRTVDLSKLGKSGSKLGRLDRNEQVLKSVLGTGFMATPYIGRSSDAIQAVQQYPKAPLLPSYKAAGTYGVNQLMNQQQMRRQGGKLYYQEDFGLLPKGQPVLQVPIQKPDALRVQMNINPNAKYEEKKKSDVLDLDNALDYLVDTRGGNRDLWGNMADTIGYHESAHTMDPLQKQIGGGPGRGIFQFEAPSLVTAQNRYKRIADRLDLKTDPEILSAKSALELSPEQQYSLFLINLSESEAKLKDYADNKLPLVDLWLQGHKNKEAKGDRGSFRTSVQKAKKDSIKSGYSTLKEFGGNLRYARGGSLTSAQDTAQAADLNKDVMRKDIKKASVGEDFMAGLYGVGEGLLDTVTFGLTDELTDAGFKALQAGAGHDVNSVEAKRQAGIKGWGNVGGAVTGAIINPASAFSAGQEGLEGIGQGIQGINPEDKTLQAVGKGVEGLGNIQLPKGMESMEGMSKLFMARNGGKFKYGYRGGGHMLNQNMGLTEIDGPSHEEGGVTLPNNGGRPDVEVEGPETIYTPENYVMSEKMKASLEALEFAGITGKSAKSLAGKSYADLSKMVKSKAGDKLRPNDPLSKKMLDKEMKRLMRAHEYDREAKRMQDEAMRTQMMGGSNVVAETPEQRAGGYNMYPNAQSIEFPGSGQTSVVPTYNNDPIMVTGADGSQQMLTDEPIETEAPFIEEKMAQGGKMIKRADGSYSKRGLWDNRNEWEIIEY
jgi:hypothetical protein